MYIYAFLKLLTKLLILSRLTYACIATAGSIFKEGLMHMQGRQILLSVLPSHYKSITLQPQHSNLIYT